MEERTKIHVGLDVHKDSISVAVAEPGRGPALRERGVQVNKACVAVARELAGFIWAIGLQAQREKEQAA